MTTADATPCPERSLRAAAITDAPRSRPFADRWRAALVVAGLALAQAAVAAPPTLSCNSNASILNTGYNVATDGILPDGSTDAYWEVTDALPPASKIQPPPAGVAWGPAYVGNLIPGVWATSPFGNANWISREGGSVNKTSADGDWYYRYQFYLDPAVTPSSFSLSMNFNSDNSVAEVYVNGVPQSSQTTGLPQPGGYFATGYHSSDAATTTLNHNWQTGLNTIVVLVQSGQNYEGFMAQMRASAVCDAKPQINVKKTTGATAIVPGGNIDYTIVVSNVGTSSASNIAVSDPLPTGLASATWTCTASGGAVCSASGSGGISDTITTLPAGAKATYTLHGVFSATPPVSVSNTASVTPPGAAVCAPSGSAPPCTSTATVPPPPPQLSFTKSAVDANTVAGGTARYTITVRNTGAVAADGTVINDPMPSGVTAMSWTCSASGTTCPAASGSGALNQTIASLPVDAILTYTINATLGNALSTGTVVTNTATATIPGGGTCAPGGSASPCSASAGTTVASAIQANNDTGSVSAGSNSTAVPNVLSNDTQVGASNPPIGSVTLTQLSSTNPGIALNTGSGAVTVSSSVPPGTYTLTYRVCDRAATPHCSTASVTVTVTAGGAGGNVTGIPTLGEWGMLLLCGLLLGFGMHAHRRS